MTTFIKTKFKISDDQTNIDKYRLAANIGFGILIKFPSQRKKLFKLVKEESTKLDFCGPVSHLRERTILNLESPSNFQVNGKKY